MVFSINKNYIEMLFIFAVMDCLTLIYSKSTKLITFFSKVVGHFRTIIDVPYIPSKFIIRIELLMMQLIANK